MERYPSTSSEQFLAIVKRAARHVAARLPVSTRGDFVDEAPGHIYLTLARYNPNAPFPRWCERVLRNHAVSCFRKFDAFRRHAKQIGHHLNRREQQGADNGFRELPVLSPGDLAEIEQWNRVDRVLLLSMSGSWDTLPGPLKHRWQHEATLDDPPTTAVLAECATTGDRLDLLAATLRLSRDAVRQRWHRHRDKLRNLTSIRSLLDE